MQKISSIQQTTIPVRHYQNIVLNHTPSFKQNAKMAKDIAGNLSNNKLNILKIFTAMLGSLGILKTATKTDTKPVEVKEPIRTVKDIKAEKVESLQELFVKAQEIEKIKLNKAEAKAEKQFLEARAAAMEEYETVCPNSEDKEINKKIKELQPLEVAEYKKYKIYDEAEEKKQAIYNELESKYQSNQITYSVYEAARSKAYHEYEAAKDKAYDEYEYIKNKHYYLKNELKDKNSPARKKYNENCTKAGKKYNRTLKKAQIEYHDNIAAYKSILMGKADNTSMTVGEGLNKIKEEFAQVKQILDKAEISNIIMGCDKCLSFNSKGIHYKLKNKSSENINLCKTLVQIANGETIPNGIKLYDYLLECDWNLGENTKLTESLCKVLEADPDIADNKTYIDLLENHIKSMKYEEMVNFFKQYKNLTLKTANGRKFLHTLKDKEPQILIDVITAEELYKYKWGKKILKQYRPTAYRYLEDDEKRSKQLNSYVPSLTEIYKSSSRNSSYNTPYQGEKYRWYNGERYDY